VLRTITVKYFIFNDKVSFNNFLLKKYDVEILSYVEEDVKYVNALNVTVIPYGYFYYGPLYTNRETYDILTIIDNKKFKEVGLPYFFTILYHYTIKHSKLYNEDLKHN
jgi:hypothetical protein